jgi:hypothetical protein
MNRPVLASGIAKLAAAGQQAGFTVEQMIDLLNAGLGVEGLIDLIGWRLEQLKPLLPPPGFRPRLFERVIS